MSYPAIRQQWTVKIGSLTTDEALDAMKRLSANFVMGYRPSGSPERDLFLARRARLIEKWQPPE